MDRHVASCNCGALRVTALGDPVRVSVCHCLACQRRTGSAFGVQARYDTERVQVTGESREWIRHADDDGEARVYRFCPQCGATVFYTFEGADDIVAIPVGAFAEPDFPPPTRFIYDDRRHRWLDLPGETE